MTQITVRGQMQVKLRVYAGLQGDPLAEVEPVNPIEQMVQEASSVGEDHELALPLNPMIGFIVGPGQGSVTIDAKTGSVRIVGQHIVWRGTTETLDISGDSFLLRETQALPETSDV